MPLVAAAVVDLGGARVPTAAVKVPLNSRLQEVETATPEARELAPERAAYEERRNRWNAIRTAMSVVASTAPGVVVAVQTLPPPGSPHQAGASTRRDRSQVHAWRTMNARANSAKPMWK